MDNLFSIAERFGTPCFVFDEVQLEARMRAVREIVPKAVGLCYSIKANPFLISAMRGLVGTLEVCSPGELEICRQQGVSPDMVLFSGVNKTKADVERAMDLGVTRFTCESPLHVRLIDEAARSRGRVYPVLLRLSSAWTSGISSPRSTIAPLPPVFALRAFTIFPAPSARSWMGSARSLPCSARWPTG